MKGMRRSRIASLCLVVMGLLLVMAGGVLQAQGPEEPPDSVGAPLVVSAVRPVTNPPLVESCGLDIVLVIDGSGSVSSTEYGQMQAALVAFVDALLPATPTEFALVEFASAAGLRQGFTADKTTIINEINQNPVQPGGQYTNWEQGLSLSHTLFPNRDNPDLIVFASDGNPNMIGDGQYVGETAALAAAVGVANDIKSDGIRIITIGIGDDLDVDNLIAISSADAVYTGDFDQLAGIFAELAIELCGGTITVYKVVGDVSSGDLVEGWTFSAGVSGGDPTPEQDTTGTDGSVVFDISIDDGSATVSITETVKAGYALVSAVCSGASNNGTFASGTHSVGGIVISRFDIASCTFTNILCADCTIETDSPVCAGSENAATGPAGMNSYTWAVTGGSLDSGQGTDTLTYTAGAGPTVTIDLTIVDANGCESSCQEVVTVDPNPVGTATNTGPVCVGKTLALIGGPDGMSYYSWSGPDGFSSSDQSPTVSSSATVAMAGTYTLSVTDLNDCIDEAETTVVVNPLPVVDAGGDLEVCADADPFALADGTESPSGGSWSGTGVTGGSFDPGTAGVGEHTITYTYTDANGCTNSDTRQITVNALPVASFDASATSGAAPVEVTFTDTSTPGSSPIQSWSWDFDGDGVEDSSEQNPKHTFGKGTHTVKLTATDENGCTDSASMQIEVAPTMVIGFSADPQCDGTPICFEAWASGGLQLTAAYSYAWDFGDDTRSTERNPCHPYAGPGTYEVTLVVTSPGGTVASTSGDVTVYANPTASFTAVPASGVAPLTVQFNDTSTAGSPNGGASIDWDWDFGDLGTSDLKSPSHEYTSAGAYTVVLMVTDEHGCTDSHATAVTVTPRPELSIEKTGDVGPVSVGDTINYTIKVTNSGDATLTNVVVNDAKLGINQTIPSLAAGAFVEIPGSYGPVTEDDLPGPIHNLATATSNETSDSVKDTWDVTLISGPAIQVVKTANKDKAMVGEPIKYTYVVTNLGDVTLTNVTLTDDPLGPISLGSTTLLVGESTSGVAIYTVVEGDLPGPLVNVATASGKPPVGPNVTDDDDASVVVVEPEAPPVLLSIQKTGDAGPLSVGDTINYTIKVTNSGDATLHNVTVVDAKLGINQNVGDLAPAAFVEIPGSYGPVTEDDLGLVHNVASATSNETPDPVHDDWTVLVVETEAPPEPTPTPTPIPCIRSGIDVIVYGKIPVQVDVYVAGDLNFSKQTAVNAFGEQQATFSVWPGEGETYVVSIAPRVPGYLSPDEWTFQLIEGSLTMRIPRCVKREVILQLLHSGPSVMPSPAPTLPVEELPVTGVPLPASSFGGRLLKVLGFLLIGLGGLFYWISSRD